MADVVKSQQAGDAQGPNARVGTVIKGKWKIESLLGVGGMASVYAGAHRNGQRAALKILHTDFAREKTICERFLREAYVSNKVNHPATVQVLDDDQTEQGEPFLIMELLEGDTVRDAWKRAGRTMPVPQVLQICERVLDCLASCHAIGVIHRDLKPANIMVGEYSLVTVMDWGLSKVLDDPQPEVIFHDTGREETPEDLHTVCGTVFGTPGYLAPEQARGEIERVDRRADVFGLGCILCEILTGMPAYRGKTPGDVWRQAEKGDTAAALARLEACDGPEAIVRLARSCLATAPELRPADAGEVVEALVTHLESGQRRAEQQLVRFFDLSIDLFCIASLSGSFLRVNDNFVRLLGYSEAELLSGRFLDFVHPEDQATTLAEVERLARGEMTHRFRNRYRRADGRYVVLEWNARTVAEEGAIYAVARDVTVIDESLCVDRLRDERDGLLARVAALERLLPTERMA